MKKLLLHFLLLFAIATIAGSFAAFAQTNPAPTNLTLRVVSSAQICLDWKDNATSELGFEIERSTDGRTFAKIADAAANATTFCNTGLSANTAYTYRVRAKLTATTFSGYSNQPNATTNAAPAAPTSLAVIVLSSSGLRLTWGPNTLAAKYAIERRQGQSGNFSEITTVEFARLINRQYDNTGLNGGTEYCYRVRIKEDDGETSPYSSIACATTSQSVPASPARLTATAVSSSQINLTWADLSDNETGFEVERSTDSRNYSKIADVGANSTAYTNTGLTGNTQYCYRVRAKNGAGNSGYTDPACATTSQSVPASPARLTATAVSSSQINLTWADLSDNETGFEIERSTDSRNYSKIADVGSDATTYSNTGLTGNTQYCYRVRAKNGAGNSGYTDPACATTSQSVPASPARLTATAVSSSQINLTWADLSDNETGFEIERSTDSRNYSKIADVGSDATTYSNTGLTGNTQYCYRVRAKNGAGNSGYTDPACATTSQSVPASPARLTATAVSSSQINLTWADLSDNETGFELERSTDGTNFSKITDIAANTTTYSNTGLNASTKYWYRIRSNNTAGASAYSNVADATTQAPPVVIPRSPSNLTATAVSSSQINLTWADLSDNETGFELERSTDGTNFSKIADIAANTTTYSNTGLNASTKYWYRIRSNNTAGASAYSNVADATTQAPPVVIPRPPSNLTATATSSSQINLSWTDNATDETGFELERSTDGTNFSKITDIVANTTTYSNTGLNASTKYWYRIRSNNTAGASAYSNVADATTQAPPVVIPRPPSSLTATATSSSQINLSWTDNATDETGFELERSTDGTNFSKIADIAANTTTYSNTGLNASTKYWYRIRSNNTAGASAYSNVADATTQAPPVVIPRPPSSLTATVTSSSQINLSWTDNATDETGFELERSTDGTNFSKIADIAANTTSFFNAGLAALTKYWYRIRATNSAGASSYSNIADATTLQAVPNIPTDLVAELADYDQIRLTWVAVANATSVLIERSTSPTTGFVQIVQQPLPATSYLDVGLNEMTTYYYRIRFSNAAGNSGYSNVASKTTSEVVIGIRPQTPDIGLEVFSVGQTIRFKNNLFQPLSIEWSLKSLNGQIMNTERSVIGGKQMWVHDLNTLKSGVYIVIVNTENRLFSTKIVLP